MARRGLLRAFLLHRDSLFCGAICFPGPIQGRGVWEQWEFERITNSPISS